MDRQPTNKTVTYDVDPTWTVNEAIARVPAAITVFNRLGIDACCGGAATIAEAAIRDGIDLETLLDALRTEVGDA